MVASTFAEPRRRTALVWVGAGGAALLGSIPFGPKAVVFGALFFLLCCVVAYREVDAAVITWPNAIAALLLVIWFIPIKSYRLPVDLPFNLEVYRLFLLLLLVVWGAQAIGGSGLVSFGDHGKPLFLLTAVVLVSQITNLDTLSALETSDAQALKSLSYFLGFLLAFTLICSTASSQQAVDRLVRVLVIGGAIVATLALYESRRRYNVFDHLDRYIPGLVKESREVEALRAGRLRVKGSSQHPIALSCALVMIMPLAIYLAAQARSNAKKGLWLAAAGLAALASFATISRTTVVMLLVMGVIALWLRGKAVVRFWPLLLLLPFAIHFVTPGALGGIRNTFFPEEGLVSGLHDRADLPGSGRLADIDPGLRRWADSPLVGHGLGSQAATGADPSRLQPEASPNPLTTKPAGYRVIFDDQYLNTLVEIGILGLVGVIWFVWGAAIKLASRARHTIGAASDLMVACCAACAGFAGAMLLFDAFAFVQATLVFFIVAALGLRARELSLRQVDDAAATD